MFWKQRERQRQGGGGDSRKSTTHGGGKGFWAKKFPAGRGLDVSPAGFYDLKGELKSSREGGARTEVGRGEKRRRKEISKALVNGMR